MLDRQVSPYARSLSSFKNKKGPLSYHIWKATFTISWITNLIQILFSKYPYLFNVWNGIKFSRQISEEALETFWDYQSLKVWITSTFPGPTIWSYDSNTAIAYGGRPWGLNSCSWQVTVGPRTWQLMNKCVTNTVGSHSSTQRGTHRSSEHIYEIRNSGLTFDISPWYTSRRFWYEFRLHQLPVAHILKGSVETR